MPLRGGDEAAAGRQLPLRRGDEGICRRGRSLAAWIGDTELAPHAAALLKEGAVDVELHFGEPIEFLPDDSRKEATR
ncbi:MAG TPA: hypothetical protein PLL33_08435, partial [Paracoccus sp. (in: a-proteobacteria)]|nr:hypothetical protein [Paracoccus sp. (in: a-proteobacteria)]